MTIIEEWKLVGVAWHLYNTLLYQTYCYYAYRHTLLSIRPYTAMRVDRSRVINAFFTHAFSIDRKQKKENPALGPEFVHLSPSTKFAILRMI